MESVTFMEHDRPRTTDAQPPRPRWEKPRLTKLCEARIILPGPDRKSWIVIVQNSPGRAGIATTTAATPEDVVAILKSANERVSA